MSKQHRTVILWIAVLLVAAFLRLYALQTRPLHSDEGVNFHFLEEITQKGYYPYSHENYHGPLFFYLSWIPPKIVGMSVESLRGTTIVFGLLTVAIPLLLVPIIGGGAALTTALLLALSSSAVFYSRYAIHETMFVFFQVIFAWSLFEERRARRGLALAAFALACLIAIKETFVLSVFWIFVGLLLTELRSWRSWHKNLANYYKTENFQLALAVLILGAVTAAIYTGFGLWSRGLRELLSALPQWIGRGTSSDVGHFKPWLYYIQHLIGRGEVTVFLLLLAAANALWDRRQEIGGKGAADWLLLTFVWAVGSLFSYSLIPYKTPWLIINITIPALLSGGVGLWLLPWRAVLRGGVISVLAAASLALTLFWNFDFALGKLRSMPYGDQNPFSYVHTSPGLMELVADVEHYRLKHPDARVLVAVDSYWPLPFYFRKFPEKLGYLTTKEPQNFKDEYSVIIAKHTVKWSDPNFVKKYYRLSDVEESFTYFKKQDDH